jgi:hypothetical protein
MNRRRYLGVVTAGLSAGFAGCGESATRSPASGSRTATPTPGSAPRSGTDATDPETTGTDDGQADTPTDGDLPVPEADLLRALPRDNIPAIVDPAFGEDWSGLRVEVTYPRRKRRDPVTVEPRLDDEDPVVGITRDGEARAYPLWVLNWHEVVNDDLGGPLLVSYCPLCGSGVTAVRTVEGQPTLFGVSGLLYRDNLVLYDDRTDSLWSQLLATAIRGPMTGTRLTLVPSALVGWGEWKRAHPDTAVLLPPPESNTVVGRDATRDYTADPYDFYGRGDWVGVTDREVDDRVHPKTVVVGVTHDGIARAYPLPAVEAEGGVVNDRVGDRPVVVASGTGDRLFAYVRRVDGAVPTFTPDGEGRMVAADTTWAIETGAAVTGRYARATLERATDRSAMYWFAWVDLHAETQLYGRNRFDRRWRRGRSD